MHSYADVDGVPPAADRALLTGLLRERWGFEGHGRLGLLRRHVHREAAPARGGRRPGAAALALAAGVDVELPQVRCFGTPLLDAVLAGDVAGVHCGPRGDPGAAAEVRARPARPWLAAAAPSTVDLDPPAGRGRSRGGSPRSRWCCWRTTACCRCAPSVRVALVGAAGGRPTRRCSAATRSRSHVPSSTPTPAGVAIPTLRAALPARWRRVLRSSARSTARTRGLAAAAAGRRATCAWWRSATESGLFGRGTSGEGSDAADLRMPGVQRAARGGAGDRHAGGAGAADRAAVRARPSTPAGAPRSCRRSSPARKAVRRGRGVLTGRVARRAGCR